MVWYNYSNKTLFGIKTDAERYAWAMWNIFVILVSFLGDTTILVASIKYKAFRMNKIIVAIIQHIAVCDLLCSLYLVPSAISLITDGMILDYKLCNIRLFLSHHANTVSLLLICVLTLGKLRLLKNPFARCSRTKAHEICAGIWIASFYVPALHLLVDMEDPIFDYSLLHGCLFRYSSGRVKWLMPVIAVITKFGPNLVIVVATVLLLLEARTGTDGSRRNLRWQGIMTVVSTATAYTLSVLPIAIYCIAEPSVSKDPLSPGPFYIYYYRIAVAFMNFNILSHFFVYSLTVSSFKIFLTNKLGLTKCYSAGIFILNYSA